MNEEAILDSYNLFVQNGYTKSLDEYKQLLSSNPNALNDSYGLFQKNGYAKSLDEYKSLMGVSQQKTITQPEQKPVDLKKNDLSIGGTGLQDGFDFSQPAPKAPSVLTPQAQEEYIAEQKTKPVQIPAPETTQPFTAPTETVAIGPMGITGLQRTKDYKPSEEFKGKSVAYITGDLLKTVGKGVVKFPADALETIAIGASAIDNLIAKTGLTEKTEASKLATYQAAQEYRKLIDEVIPTNKDIESGFWGQSANALGQMVPIILSGFTAGGAKAIATQAAKKGTKLESIINYGKTLASRMATPQGGLTISQVAAPSYEQAKSEGATENEALTYAIQNALVSYPIEMLPVDGLFKRLDKALVGNRGVDILKKAVIGGSEEAITEGIQNVYENLSANQIYGTTKDFLEGTGNASAVGGTVGLITNGLLTALLGRRARATTNEEIVELDKSIEDTKKKVEQINSNNERFIETINTLEQFKPISLAYGSAEYNFIESPEGNLELAQDDITKEQAEGIIKNLSGTYKKIEFSIQEIEPEDPYQPTTYKVVGTPIKTEITVEAPEVTQKRVDRIAEIETTLAPESTIVIEDAEKIKLQTELETLKSEQDAVQVKTAGQVPVLTEAGVGEEVVQGEPKAEPQGVTEEGAKAEEVISDTGVSLDVIVDPVNIELKNNKIEGKLFNEQESVELQKEIESKYNNSDTPINKRFGQENEDIRQNAFNYDSPAAQKNVNGVDVRIVSGLVEGKAYSGKRRQTYLLYADGKIAGKFYSLSDAKKVVDFIEANLVKSLPTQEVTPTQQLKAEAPIVSEEAVSEITRESIRLLTDEEVNPLYDEIPMNLLPIAENVSKQDAVFNAYFKSKQNNTNPDLVQAVEKIMTPSVSLETQNIPTELQGKTKTGTTGFGGVREHTTGKVNLEDLTVLDNGIKTAEETIANNPSFKPSNKPVVVGVDVETGEKQLLDGYHRYVTKGRTGQVQAQFIPMRNGEVISFEEVSKPILQTQTTAEVTPQETVKAEEGFQEISTPLTIFKGSFGKKNIDGTVRTAHPNVKGVFGSTDLKIAKRYSETGKEIQEFNIPAGVTLETVRVKNRNQGLGAIREQETDLINNSKAQIVKLITIDASGREEQYIIKDKSLLKKTKAKKTKTSLKVEPVTEDGPTDQDLASIDALLDLDVTDQDNLDMIFGFLDNADKSIGNILKGGANEAMLAIPLNVVRVAIKTLKALVQGGMLLRDAIKKVAADNDISQDTIKDIINIAPIQDSFYSLMDKVDAFITRQKGRGIQDSKITSNVDTYIRKQDEYLNANDVQKKIIEREARAKMGAAPKRAVSIGRVLGALKDITNISRAEKLKIISQIRQLSKDAAKDLAKEIRSMASSDKITAVQAANIISRFGKVNMLNEISVSNFVDYMAKVFANAEYANKIDVAKSKLKNARQNIATKIGIADGLVGPLQRLFSVNPNIIPDQYLERYLELLNMFSERKAVLTLQEKSKVIKDVESILNEIDIEQSKADELDDRFNNSENKVFGDEGKLDFVESIKEMVKQGEITQEEADIMRKYKSDIMPQVESQKMTEEEIAEEKEGLIKEIEDADVVFSGLPTADERNLANRLKDLISTSAIDKLTNTELKNLLKVIGNINNNYLPHYAQIMVEKLTAINNAKTLTSAIKKAVIAPLSGLYSRVKSFVLRSKRTAISEMIRRNPLFNVDQLFGDFKTKDIFNAVLNKVSEGEARFKTDLKRVQNILEKAEEKVAKSFGLNPDKTLMSKFKMMTYMIQLEYDSNQGSKQVNPAAEYLRATIKHIDEGKSQFGERDANMLQEILDKYIDSEGNIDNDKLYKSFNEAEKSAIKDIRGVNESLREKAEYTAAIIRGDRINPLTNYVHLNVLHEHQPNDLTSGVAFVNDYNNAMRPSTKAKSLIERTGKVSPLNFDIFASAQRGAKFVLMDYNLTEPIRTARKTIKQTIFNFEEEGRIPKEKREIINAIDSAFEEATENVLTNNFVSNSFGDDVVDYIQKQGYRAVLAGTGRFVSELTSNIGFALIVDPKAFTTGIENRGFIMSVDAPLVMENVGSKQTNRVFPTDTLSGKLVDTNILQQASGIRGAKSKNPVANKIQQIWNLSGKKYVNTVELMADALISTPDKLMMRPMWFGSFANEFQNITGEKVNFDKIAAKDESYMEQYKEAIEKSKTIADEKSVMAGSTDNAFMGILKGTTKPDQSVTTRAFNNFNNFMTKFLIFEYVTARTGINAAMGNGSLTKKQGVALLGAVTTRMVVYTLLTQMLGSGLMGLFFDDDEEETEKSFMQKLGQSLTSTFTSLILGRDFGNATKMIINEGVERANEKYLDFLREGEYDPYKDAIQYSIVPNEKKGRQTDLFDFFLNMGGSFGPALKTADFITRKAFEPEKKKEDAIERREKEINVRIPLEILGNAGLIPLYKDIRKSVMKDIYKDLEKAEKTLGDKKKIKAEKLQGYETESDMKRYDPQLWDRTFGQDAVDYDEVQAEKALKKAKDSLARAMKDDMYNYTPKTKGGFGSAGFGEKSKSKGGFGSAKFGGN